MGEVARAYLLARWCRIPYGTTVASLVVERVLDGLSLAVLLLVALTLVPSAPGYLLVGRRGRRRRLSGRRRRCWRWPPGARRRITAVAGFVARLLPAAIRRAASSGWRRASRARWRWCTDPGRLARLLGLSLLAWCFELGLFFVLLLSFGCRRSYPLALLVGSAANFATLVPSSPGYAGTFDAALIKRRCRTSPASPPVQATAYDVVVHATLFLPVVVVGTLVLWRSHMTFGQITHAPERVDGPQTAAARPAGRLSTDAADARRQAR